MENRSDSIPSTAAIGGHPIHPMLVPFPIAFLVGTLVTDVAYILTDTVFWADASKWLVGAGMVMGAVAAVFGLIDFVTKDRIRSYTAAWIHFLGNAAAVVLALISLILRLGGPSDAADAVVPGGIILSVLIAGILTVTGWLGGELSYRYRVGVISKP